MQCGHGARCTAHSARCTLHVRVDLALREWFNWTSTDMRALALSSVSLTSITVCALADVCYATATVAAATAAITAAAETATPVFRPVSNQAQDRRQGLAAK